MLKFLQAAIIIFFIISKASAQTAVLPAGGNAANGTGSISYSIGQIDYIQLTSTTNAGVQQVYDSMVSFPVPVEFLNITATRQGKNVLINWETATENNSSHFMILRAGNGVDFNTNIGTVLAAGYSNKITAYSLLDRAPLSGTNYYHIKQFDKDGRFFQSAIVAVNFTSGLSVVVSPNPTTAFIQVKITESDMYGYTYKLYDISGKLVSNAALASSISTIDLAGLKAASYVLNIFKKGSKVASLVIIKK